MKPRIAYILKMYPRFSETFIVNEILELERRGVDIRIYSLRKPDDGRFHASLAQVRANVIYAPEYPEMEPARIEAGHAVVQAAFPERYAAAQAFSEAQNHPYARKRFLQAGFIAGHLLQHPVDAMHAHFASSAARIANLVNQMTGLPYSFTAHAKDIYHEEVSPASLRQKMAAARFVVTVSRFNQAHLQAIAGPALADIRCLYNGIDLHLFHPDAAVQQASNVILGIGRLVEKKGFDTLIRACGLLSDWGVDYQCRIIGSGDQRDALKGLIDELGLAQSVYLLGPRPQEEVQLAYRQAAVFALPCIVGRDGNRDGLPTVLLEAMASGLPAVSTLLTGIPEIIDDGVNGLLTEPGAVEPLARALADLLAAPRRRYQMGLAARDKVERLFDLRQNAGQLFHWLAEPVKPACEPYLPHPTVVDSPSSKLNA